MLNNKEFQLHDVRNWFFSGAIEPWLGFVRANGTNDDIVCGGGLFAPTVDDRVVVRLQHAVVTRDDGWERFSSCNFVY